MSRVTRDQIKAKIRSVEYHSHGLITICFITMENGFVATGQSACANPDLYDKERGEQGAYNDCFNKLSLLEGYLLKQKLYELGETA